MADRDVSDDELLDLMVAEPTLLRRPLVITERGVVVGFNRNELERIAASEER